ncbi:YdcH family protein [Magnetococcus sp. PR-3]|uniref:YdcH family protein n=1 Tax=Magnetococcus sp. PR-3 TaxID=3120355 RepID=UPI002FCE02F6
MFEDQLQAVNELISSNSEFKALHDRHHELDEKISELSSGPIDDFTLEKMKKEKLMLKDQMASLLAEHTQ